MFVKYKESRGGGASPRFTVWFYLLDIAFYIRGSIDHMHDLYLIWMLIANIALPFKVNPFFTLSEKYLEYLSGTT